MDVVRIIQRLGSAPDDSERGRLIGRRRQVGKLHIVAVDDVAQERGLLVRHLHVSIKSVSCGVGR